LRPWPCARRCSSARCAALRCWRGDEGGGRRPRHPGVTGARRQAAFAGVFPAGSGTRRR
jgi:hypothetical protein